MKTTYVVYNYRSNAYASNALVQLTFHGERPLASAAQWITQLSNRAVHHWVDKTDARTFAAPICDAYVVQVKTDNRGELSIELGSDDRPLKHSTK